jgi:glutathionyl-hydroquinone reductase
MKTNTAGEFIRSESSFRNWVTVPVLYDKQRRIIVNNESSEIIRKLNSAFDAWGRKVAAQYPEPVHGGFPQSPGLSRSVATLSSRDVRSRMRWTFVRTNRRILQRCRSSSR